MRLGLIYHQFVRSGGLENYLIQLATRLEAAGHGLTLVTSKIAPEVEQKLKAEVRMVAPVQGSKMLQMWHFARTTAGLVPGLGVDVTIGFGRTWAHDLHRAGGGCHAMYSALLPWWKRYGLKNLLELHLERQLYTGGRTRHFVTNSNRVTAQLRGVYKTPGEQFTTIHTAVETSLFKPAESRAVTRELECRKLRTDASKPVLLFVSLSHRRKGLDALIKAMHSVDATLWIVGKPLDSRYLGLIKQYGVEDRVRVVPVTNSLVELFQAADWFVHPTLYDACANTVLQSMASGLPGIISARDGAIDHVLDGENGFMLFHPQDAKELAATINKALSLDAAQWQRMSQAARETVLPFTWDWHVGRWETLISSLPRRR